MMKRFVTLAILATLASGANAQWFLRGEFNGWDTSIAMTDMGGGHWMGTAAVTSGNLYEYKVALADWSDSAPGSNGRFLASSGAATVHFWEAAAVDGWEPTGRRVGYTGAGNTWEVAGGFNGWSGTGFGLTDMGGGLYTGTFAMTAATGQEFKFRKTGGWDISIGNDFGNSAANIVKDFNAGQYKFDLDIANGRYRVTEVPEPASMAILGLGALALVRRRRSK